MNVWKVGSRWSSTGDSNFSVKELFIEHNLFIVGGEKARTKVQGVKLGDLVALADGVTVIAVGVVESNATNLTNINFDDKIENYHNRIQEDFNDGWPMVVRTHFYRLNGNDQFKYNRGEFHRVGDNHYNKRIQELYKLYNNQFEIDAETWSLNTLIKNKYQIPVYQRPYSWNKIQIETFLNDIFNNYWGFNRDSVPEPMFIGTMQISALPDKKSGFYEVTDGQQRLTTILILLFVLNKRYDRQDSLNWLNTTVNNGSQQKLLEQLIKGSLNELVEETTNKYVQNAFYINSILTTILETESESCFESFNIESFISYLYNQIKFVVVKIKAGLSKTLQIFDTINTAGLSLAGSDIFKLRMFEYLDKKEGAFDEINKIYQNIEEKNNTLGFIESDINQILTLYQNKLIAKYNLPNVLHDYSQNRFFDELFDTKFGIKQHQHFQDAKEVVLSINEIQKLIEIRYKWVKGYYVDEDDLNLFTGEDYCLSHQIGWSRYSRYWILRFLFVDRFPDRLESLPLFMSLLSKFLITYSILFERTIYHVHTTIRILIHLMYKRETRVDDIISSLQTSIKNDVPMRGNTTEALKNVLEGNIFYSAKKKNIICRLSAMFDEENLQSSSRSEIETIIDKIYGQKDEQKIDIEHIHATADQSNEFENNLQNGIGNLGNLVILEYKLNRSIGKKPYSEKRERYRESKISSVQKIAQTHSVWGEEEAMERLKFQSELICNYLLKTEIEYPKYVLIENEGNHTPDNVGVE